MRKYFLFICSIPFLAVIMWIYELRIICVIPLLITWVCLVNKLTRYNQNERQEETRFLQVSSYLEQLLCSYRRLGHAGKALDDCQILFAESSEMGAVIRSASCILKTGEGVEDGNIYEAAFGKIEQRYNSRRMSIIHRFVCNGEKTGGDTNISADILLEDLECWKNRTRLYQKKKQFVKIECAIASSLALLLCYVSKLLTPAELGFRISDSTTYQISTVAAFVVMMIIVMSIFKKLSGSWLDERQLSGEKEILKRDKLYQIIQSDRRKYSSVSFHMAKKILTRYVREEFPYWLLLVTLYLQSESSYQALRLTLDETEDIFKEEVCKMIERIYDSPRDLQPYLEFFGQLSLVEVETGMKILYSVNNNGYEESKRQLDFLIAQNNRLVDQCEVYHYKNKMAGMSLLKQLPMIVSCIKLLIDLVNLLALTMGSFQNIQM